MTGRLRALGPAIIVASVVLGPGSILLNSRVGCEYGYDLVWVLVAAVLLMIGMTMLSARLGVTLDGSIGDEITRGFGRPLAAFVGVVLFLVVACFQFSNNVGVVAALQPFLGKDAPWAVWAIIGVNGSVVLALLGLRRLYRPVEVLMKVLVGLMAAGFLGNLLFVRPSPAATFGGLVPRLPGGDLLPLVGLAGTTFSVAGAFYQAYLARKKGWTRDDLRSGAVDSVVGIAVLGVLSLTIMITSAATLHGTVAPDKLRSAADVATQLAPLFGSVAKVLFCVGLFAGALSSFLVNAMIGGTVLSDGLGLGADMDTRWPKAFTVLALLAGMGVAIFVVKGGEPIALITLAQALTVLGNPVLAGVLLWLAVRSGAPATLRAVASLGCLVALALAARTLHRLL